MGLDIQMRCKFRFSREKIKTHVPSGQNLCLGWPQKKMKLDREREREVCRELLYGGTGNVDWMEEEESSTLVQQ